MVATAEKAKVVMTVMALARTTTRKTRMRPRCPTSHPVRRYMITPRMVRMVGVKTPTKVPSLFSRVMVRSACVLSPLLRFEVRCEHPTRDVIRMQDPTAAMRRRPDHGDRIAAEDGR